jgi:hypothetical protein
MMKRKLESMFGVWNRLRLLLVLALPIIGMVFSGCPGPGDPVFGSCAACTECNPKTAFANATVPLPQGASHVLFSGGKPEYGCIGVTWAGQKDAPPGFVAKLNADGSYEVLNPTTRTFTSSDQIVANVAPGVGEITAWFFVFKGTEQEALTLDCSNVAKGGSVGCVNNPACLFSWQVKTNAAGQGGTCSLCRRELCNGKDDDCDGDIDEDGACGRLFATVYCKSYDKPTLDDGAPKCDGNSACSCLVLNDASKSVYVCAGDKQENVKWTKLSDAQAGCKTAADASVGKKFFCSSEPLICDTCPSLTPKVGWRFTGQNRQGCTSGNMTFQ